ncbi:MAG: NAD(P)/FAD-dependent oxidoreductase [Burkholderiales bacterium]|nr:NAD(P)/FAD-dependent oxidoreductase [Burkholderiales bacterium]
MSLQVQAVVIGAGAVGLACARALALAGKEVIILERNTDFGLETSARNSEVIHAGIYYPPGSLKAKMCVQGRQRLYAFCQSHGVEHSRCGKLIVATSERQLSELKNIQARALANGVDDLELLTASQAVALEPSLHAMGALLSPSTGIINGRAYMLALLGEAELHGASLALNSRVQSMQSTATGLQLSVLCDGVEETLLADLVVNAAGHQAIALANTCDAVSAEKIPRAYLAKGNYFSLAGRSPFSRLIYPVPEPGGLGVHLTLDLGLQARFGPDVEWVQTEDYSVNPQRAEVFYAAIRKYWPDLKDDALQPAYAGIRPKTVPQGSPDADFQVQGPDEHGVAGLVNFYGIESPGLTSSLALAHVLCERLGLASPSQSA